MRSQSCCLVSVLLLAAVPLLGHQDIERELMLLAVFLEIIPDGLYGFAVEPSVADKMAVLQELLCVFIGAALQEPFTERYVKALLRPLEHFPGHILVQQIPQNAFADAV